MATYVTPGVYYERADAGDAAVAPLRTDIAGFVGIARRGPVDLALPVESWRHFVACFGDFTGAGYLAYAVRGFFENGGRRCWIVRVASTAAAAALRAIEASPLPMPAPAPPPPSSHAWDVAAASPGVWGNDLEIEWRETHRAQTTANPARSMPEFATVASVAGFERGTHVRAFTAPAVPEYRVVSAVDADRRRLYWLNPRPALRLTHQDLTYEQPLAGYDPVRPLLIESIEYSLLVRELGRLTTVVEGLSLVPGHRRYGPTVLAPLPVPEEGWSVRSASVRRKEGRAPRRRAGVLDPAGGRDQLADEAPNAVVIVERREAAAVAQLWPLAPRSLGRRPLAGGLDGLAPLTVRDFLGRPSSVFDDVETRRRKRRGLRALEPVSEVALVAIPDIHIQAALPPVTRMPPVCHVDPCLPPPPASPATPHLPSTGDLPPRFTDEQIVEVQQAIVEHCAALKDRFALLDPPFDTVHDWKLGIGPLTAWRRRFDSDVAALYAPWLRTPDPLRLEPSGLRAVPPSGHVAGFIAQTDVRFGVHRAPANGALNWVQGTTMAIDEAWHGVLNAGHVNAIRAFAGRGLRIFGARTLSSDPDWRFVNVRRLLLMLEKAIRIGCQWATFEPNNRLTRAKLHLALTSLLLDVWRRGALAGKTAHEAFYVNCGETENPAETRARGMLVAEVGVAAAKPFEFVVVRVGVSDNTLEITETGGVETVS
jgi:phage tail sheath protein FI